VSIHEGCLQRFVLHRHSWHNWWQQNLQLNSICKQHRWKSTLVVKCWIILAILCYRLTISSMPGLCMFKNISTNYDELLSFWKFFRNSCINDIFHSEKWCVSTKYATDEMILNVSLLTIRIKWTDNMHNKLAWSWYMGHDHTKNIPDHEIYSNQLNKRW